MTDHRPGDPMPYVRDPELCEICGQRQWPESYPLMQITLEPASGGTPSQPNFRAARVMFICSRHAADGSPTRAPHTAMREGTSRKHPQTETLFELPADSAIREGRDA